MSIRKVILNNLINRLISIQVYPTTFNLNFSSLITEFEKWVGIEVAGFNSVSDEMEAFILESRIYAVFLYKNLSTETIIFQYNYESCLSNSNYFIDKRPHFELLEAKYKNNEPD